MTRSFHKTKEAPHHCHTNAAGAVKSSPLKVKKEGYGGKGSWGSTNDEIHDARQMLDDGDLPPVSSPEREKSMRKLSISSSSSSETSNGNTIPGLTTPSNGNKATDKIVEEDSEWVNEPEETTAAAVAAADKA